MIQDLVGIPWKYGEMDCCKLMILAQKELFGRELKPKYPHGYTPETLNEESRTMIREFNEIGYPVVKPKAGDLVVLEIFGGYHVATFISDFEILHIFEEHTSRISKYNSFFKRRTIAIYRLKKEVGE
jgi:hypothetical protein